MKFKHLAASLATIVAVHGATALAEEQDANAEVGVIKLNVTNFSNDIGKLYITVYDSKKTWLKEAVFSDELVVSDNLRDDWIQTEISLPHGEYAISVHHDANGNEKMDSNFIGIPKEPVGMSKNQVPKFGPPKFKKSVFSLGSEPHEENIQLLD